MQTTKQTILINGDNATDIFASILHADADPSKPKIGAPFVVIVAKTQPRFRGGKSSPFPKGSVYKIAKVQIQLGVRYTNAVNNQRRREGLTTDFESEGRLWGEQISGTPFVVHTPKNADAPRLYLNAKVHRSIEYRYEDANGNELDKASVNAWIYRSPNANKNQGTDKPTYWRNYPLTSVLAMHFNGNVYVVEDNLTLLSDLTAVVV